MDVICEGVLELGSNPSSSSSKDWKPRLFVLHHDKDTKLTTLQFYKDTKKRWQKQIPKGLIPLVPSFDISLAHNCSYHFPIRLVDGNRQTHYLSAKTFPEMNMWYNCIQRQRILQEPTKGYYEYQLKPKESKSMTLIEASTVPCLISLTPQREIICANAQSRQVLGVWPYSSLRRHWHGEGMFGFEAGRRSPRGEGKFEFVTSRGKEIYKKLDMLMKTESPKTSKHYDTRPPAPLPSATTPPVSSASDSEDDEKYTPPPSSSSSSGKQSKRTESVNLGSNTTEVSGTSPVYHRRVMSTGPGGKRRTQEAPLGGNKWLHETVDPGSPSNQQRRMEEARRPGVSTPPPPLPPPPAALKGDVIGSSQPVEEDMYSHTVHKFPEPFQRQAADHSAIGGNIYNALVHQQSSIKRKGRHSSQMNDELVYDVAFQPSSMGRAIPVTQEGEYAIASHPTATISQQQTDRYRTLDPASQPPSSSLKKRVDNPLYGSKDDLTEDTDSRLLDNPLYGSKENLVSDKDGGETDKSKEVQAHLAVLATLGEGAVGSEGTSGIDDNSMTLNPIYGTTGPTFPRYQPQGASQSSESSQSSQTDGTGQSGEISQPVETRSDSTEPSSNRSNSTDDQTGQEKTQEDSSSQRVPEARAESAPSDHPIQRDAKGYSKIDKNKKTDKKQGEADKKDSEEGEEEVPPPIPARNYSVDGESPPQSLDNQ